MAPCPNFKLFRPKLSPNRTKNGELTRFSWVNQMKLIPSEMASWPNLDLVRLSRLFWVHCMHGQNIETAYACIIYVCIVYACIVYACIIYAFLFLQGMFHKFGNFCESVYASLVGYVINTIFEITVFEIKFETTV